MDDKVFNINNNFGESISNYKFLSPSSIKKLLPELPNSLETLLSKQLVIIKEKIDRDMYILKMKQT